MRPQRVIRGQQFTGGLNLAASAESLGPNDCTVATNARIDEAGNIVTRGGSRSVANILMTAQRGFGWQRSGGTIQQLYLSGGLLYTGSFPRPIAFSAQVGAFSSSAVPSFAPFRENAGNEVVYIADGGPLNKWDGTTVTVNLAGTPNISRVWVYNARLFAVSGTDETLYWSGLNDGDSLGVIASGGGFATVRTYGGQRLLNGVALGASNLLFHEHAISRFTGTSQDDIAIAAGAEGISPSVGLWGADAGFCVVDGRCYFASKQGLYVCDETGVAPAGRPERVDPLRYAARYAPSSGIYSATLGAQLVYLPTTREILVTGAEAYCYNVRADAWTYWTGLGMPLGAAWATDDNAGKSVLLWPNGTDVMELDPTDSVTGDPLYYDDIPASGTTGTAITMTVTGRHLDAGAPGRKTVVRRATADVMVDQDASAITTLTLALAGGDTVTALVGSNPATASAHGSVGGPMSTAKNYAQATFTSTPSSAWAKATVTEVLVEFDVYNRPNDLF